MGTFPEHILNEIKNRLTLSDVVSKRVALKREGNEQVGLSPFQDERTPSFKVNDTKKMYHCFASGKSGDVFSWLTEFEGMSFPEAVRHAAQQAGVSLPDDYKGGGAKSSTAGQKSSDSGTPRVEEKKAKREIVATYDYTDGEGTLIYQVVRQEWTEDGKRKKTFFQRQPSPDKDGAWIVGLESGDYLKPTWGPDWIAWSKHREENWKGAVKRTFTDIDVEHGLYRLPKVLSERDAIPDDCTVYLVEGEKDVHTLEGWGLVATTNSGGAKHWRPELAETFRNLDVVILPDNDKAGRERVEILGRALHKVARRVRVLNIAEHWPECPEKGDISDWAQQAGGSADKLFAFLDKVPDWKPEPAKSKFGRMRWSDQESSGPEYEYLIKGIIPRGEAVLIYGPSQSGKSYETFNLGMHVALGWDFQGHRTRQGLVIYGAQEGGKGMRDRARAYRKHHELRLEGVPFEILTRRADLFSDEVDTEDLIAEILAIKAEYEIPLEVFVIDTFSAATPGLKENSSEDISRVRQRVAKIMDKCKCGVWIVHHMNAAGERPRGHTSLYADIETAIEIVKKQDKGHNVIKDDNGRDIRHATVRKQREGQDGINWEFVLPAIEVRKDADGDPVTACVPMLPARAEQETERKPKPGQVPARNGVLLNDGEQTFFQVLLKAIDEAGIATPPELKLPQSVAKVIDWRTFGRIYKRTVPNDESDDDAGKKRYNERIKKAVDRARKYLLKTRVIGIDSVGDEPNAVHYMWPSGRRVIGTHFVWPPEPKKVKEPEPQKPLLAPGEIEDDTHNFF